MDPKRFDRSIQNIGHGTSRRQVLIRLLGGLALGKSFALFGVAGSEAKKGKGKRKKKRKKRKVCVAAKGSCAPAAPVIVDHCTEDHPECPGDLVCNHESGECVECTVDAHCDAFTCDSISGRCHTICFDDFRCRSGFHCTNPDGGTCRECVFEDHCQGNYRCTENGQCLTTCNGNEDCWLGYECDEAHDCVSPPPECESDEACGPGTLPFTSAVRFPATCVA
jgi:hypothetical protein